MFHKFEILHLKEDAYPSLNLYFTPNSQEFKDTLKNLQNHLAKKLLSIPPHSELVRLFSKGPASIVIEYISGIILDNRNYLMINSTRSKYYPQNEAIKDDVVVIYLLPAYTLRKLKLVSTAQEWKTYYKELTDSALIPNFIKKEIENRIKYYETTPLLTAVPDAKNQEEIFSYLFTKRIKIENKIQEIDNKMQEPGKISHDHLYDQLTYLYSELRNFLIVNTSSSEWSKNERTLAKKLLEHFNIAATSFPYHKDFLSRNSTHIAQNHFAYCIGINRAKIANDIAHYCLAQGLWKEALEHFKVSNNAVLQKPILVGERDYGTIASYLYPCAAKDIQEMVLVINNCEHSRTCYQMDQKLAQTKEAHLNEDMFFQYSKHLAQARHDKVVHAVPTSPRGNNK